MVEQGVRRQITAKAAMERKIRLFREDRHRMQNREASRYRLARWIRVEEMRFVRLIRVEMMRFVRWVRMEMMRFVRWIWMEAAYFVRGVQEETKSRVVGMNGGMHRAVREARNLVDVVDEVRVRGVGVLRSGGGGKGRCGRERLLRGKGS